MRVLDWDEFLAGKAADAPLCMSIGVFDGVHRGHQALIREICDTDIGAQSAIVTFRKNPLETLMPGEFSGNICGLERKLELFASLGVQSAVLIDFSVKFSTMKGREFVSLLFQNCHLKQLVLGRNFRCGSKLDTGIAEIEKMAADAGVKIRAVQPVMEGSSPVSSSRIRNALAGGNFTEAARLSGRNAEIDLMDIPFTDTADGLGLLFHAHKAQRIIPPEGSYPAAVYSNNRSENSAGQKKEMMITVQNGNIIIKKDSDKFIPVRFEFIT
ncbi:MAG: FAD synthetase family protein [Treponema sp.]|nr:FAD synthetase family protein [Treponema sp.]